MKIAQKLILILLGTSLLPLFCAGIFSYLNTQRVLTNQIEIRLGNIADFQTQKIKADIDTSNARLAILSDRVQIRWLLDQYNRGGGQSQRLAMDKALTDLLPGDPTFERIHILNPQGIVVGSTDTTYTGTDYSKQEVFQEGKQKATTAILFKNRGGELRQYLAAPLTLDDRLLGVVVVENQASSYLGVTGDYSQLGTTGESYLIRKLQNGTTQYISPPRYKPAALLKSAPNSDAPKSDYRGHSVFATARDLAGGWKLITKIDISEVNGPLITERNSSLTLLAVALVIVGFGAWYLVWYITVPIKRLTYTATRIRQGDLTQRVHIESHDEIGLLSSAFNEMTDHLVESEARLTASILSLPFGFGLIDTQNRVLFANPLLSQMLGHPIPSDPNRSQAVLERIDQDFKHVISLKELITRSQEKHHSIEKNIEYGPLFFRMFFAPIKANDGRILGTVMIMEDTTERMALERSRDEFFSIASHELRTPLTAVRGNTDMILNYYKEQISDPDLKLMINDIYDASTRLIDIVNDFLDMSRLEQGRMLLKPTAFDMQQLIKDIIREFDVTGSRRKLKIELADSHGEIHEAFADRNRARQILVNLLGNAIKFTKVGGVTFTVTQSKHHVEVAVTDTGTGISLKSQHLLFHKFQQAADSILTRDSSRSTGLGLYISKLICENMGGTIKLVHSEEGKGSTFAFTLPIATPALIKKAAKEAGKFNETTSHDQPVKEVPAESKPAEDPAPKA